MVLEEIGEIDEMRPSHQTGNGEDGRLKVGHEQDEEEYVVWSWSSFCMRRVGRAGVKSGSGQPSSGYIQGRVTA